MGTPRNCGEFGGLEESVSQGQTPLCPVQGPWLSAEWEEAARHTTAHCSCQVLLGHDDRSTDASRSKWVWNELGWLRSPTEASSHRKNIYFTERCFLESHACNSLHRSSRVLATAGFCLPPVSVCMGCEYVCVCVWVCVTPIIKQSAKRQPAHSPPL